MSLDCGSLLNQRYRIIDILGQGGMAAVYHAIDENLGVEVAVKENLFTSDEYIQQFRLEAELLAVLRHPHLPRVTDHFVVDKQGQYLVMDYIPGEDLRQRMDRIGFLPDDEIIIIGVAICKALSYLHSRTSPVLHRDIKPGNVRISPSGQIYLVDFGLAKIYQDLEITSTGARAMTPGFSPPEQYGTARTDHRSDIYSLGATLYSASTRQLPEDGLGRALGRAELTPLYKYNPDISRRLASVIEKALEVKPENRYQSAEDFEKALSDARSISRRRQPVNLYLPPPPTGDEIKSDDKFPKVDSNGDLINQGIFISDGIEAQEVEAINSGDSEDKNRKLGRWFIPTILIIGLLSLILIFLWIKPELANKALSMVSPSTLVQKATALKPVNTQQVGSKKTLTPTNEMVSLLTTVTPASTKLRSSTPGSTFTIQPSQTPSTEPMATLIGGGVGQIAFASDRSGVPEVWIVDVDGTNLYQLTNIREGACQPDWSPDGRRIVFVSPCEKNKESYPGSGLFIIDIDGGEIIPLPSAPGGDYDPDWSPDGKQIAFTSLREGGMKQIFVINLVDYSVFSLAEENPKESTLPKWSPDGKRILYVGSDNRFWSMSPDGSDRFAVGGVTGDYLDNEPAWSPDGASIVFTRRSLDDTTGSTWLMAVPYAKSGDVAAQIPNSELSNEAGYSPDGYWLVVRKWATGNHEIFLMRPNGVDLKVLSGSEAYDFDPDWNPASPP